MGEKEEKILLKKNVLIGRHCSVSPPKFLLGALEQTLFLGCNTLTFFLDSPRSFLRKRTVETIKANEFKEEIKKKGLSIEKIVVHGPYIVNLANVDSELVFKRSIEIIKKELKFMEDIGLNSLVLHFGSPIKNTIEKGLDRLVEAIDIIFQECKKGYILLENSCNRSKLGGNFEHFAYIIKKTKEGNRIRVCLDTSHLYTSGYDIKDNLEEVLKQFDNIVGLEKISAIHINDSFYDLNSGRDKHENIGFGKIGENAIKNIIFHPKLLNIPMLLETPFRGMNEALEEIKRVLN